MDKEKVITPLDITSSFTMKNGESSNSLQSLKTQLVVVLPHSNTLLFQMFKLDLTVPGVNYELTLSRAWWSGGRGRLLRGWRLA